MKEEERGPCGLRDSQDISNREEERGRGGLGRDREIVAGIQAKTWRRPSAVCGESVL